MPHTVILRSVFDRQRAHRMIEAAPEYAVVTVKAGDRTLDQNAKMWAMLTDISRAKPEGRHWPPETWKAAFMHYLGHQVQFAEGLDGSGPFPIGFRTSRLTKPQMSDLIEVMYKYGAEHGVKWSDEPDQ